MVTFEGKVQVTDAFGLLITSCFPIIIIITSIFLKWPKQQRHHEDHYRVRVANKQDQIVL